MAPVMSFSSLRRSGKIRDGCRVREGVFEPRNRMLPLADAARSLPFELLLVCGYLGTAAALGKVIQERRRRFGPASSAAELERVPGGYGRQLQERPAADREQLPVADEVEAEGAPGLVDAPIRRELDEVGGLLLFELVPAEQTEL